MCMLKGYSPLYSTHLVKGSDYVGHPISHLLEKAFIYGQLQDVNPGRGQGFIWHPTSPIPCSASQVCPYTIKVVLSILVLTCEKIPCSPRLCNLSLVPSSHAPERKRVPAFRSMGAGNEAIKFNFFFLSGLSTKCFERC